MSPAPVAPSLQIDLQGYWRCYTHLLPKECAVLGVVTIGVLIMDRWCGWPQPVRRSRDMNQMGSLG